MFYSNFNFHMDQEHLESFLVVFVGMVYVQIKVYSSLIKLHN